MGMIFDSDSDDYLQRLEEDFRAQPAAPPRIGKLKAAGMGLMRGGVAAAKGAAMVAAALTPWGNEDDPQAFLASDHILPRKEDFFSFIEGPLARAEKYWSPDPQSVGLAEQIIGGVAELPLMLSAGPQGMVAFSTMGTGAGLVQQGVDPTTATTAALLSGTTLGAMMMLPAAGKTLQQTAGIVAAQPVLGVAQRQAEKSLLDARGYDEQAAGIDPIDPAALITDTTLGAVFGAYGWYGHKLEADVRDVNKNILERGEKIAAELRQKLPVELVDGLDVMAVYRKILDANPFNRGARSDIERHIAVMEKAGEDLAAGRPVDVAELVKLTEPVPRTYTAERLRGDLKDAIGLSEEQLDGYMALLSARAKVQGQDLDAWISSNIAGVTKGMDEPAGALFQREDTPDWQAPRLAEQTTVNDYIDRALIDRRFVADPLPLREVSPAEARAIRELTGEDVVGGRHEINVSDLRHVINSHGNAEIERKRGQIAVTADDLKLIPEILDSYDNIRKGSEQGGQKSVVYEKRVNGTIYYIERVLRKGKVLAGKTMWKKPSAGADAASPGHTSDTADGLTPSTEDILFQNRPLVQPFYSKVLAEVERLSQEKWNGDQLLAKLRKTQGVKGEEIAWTGLDEFLAGKKSVTRAEVREFLAENQLRVEEITKKELTEFDDGSQEWQFKKRDAAKYGDYTFPGGENYRELLLTLPPKEPGQNYYNQHFRESNILAHVRFNEHTGPNGERILHLEEVQSDWAQDARKGKSVPDAPFISSTEKWAGLALRRMLRWAAEHGFDRMSWTTGEQQADRYDISRLLDEVTYRKSGHTWQIDGYRDGAVALSRKIPDVDLDDAVGKELAQKIRDGEGTQRYPGTSTPDMSLKGLDLKVGGHGMKGFYDGILTRYLDTFGKKFGAQVVDVELPEAGAVHSLPITDAMRDALLYEGQPLFQGEKGAVTFLADGRALIHALEAPDFSTLIHETAHIFERGLTPLEKREFDAWLHSVVPGTKWSTRQQEVFARAFERYLAEGKAPAPELQGVFDKFKNWLLEVYQRISGTALDVRMNDNVRAAFDWLLFDATVKREHPPEVQAVRAEVDRLAPELEAEAYTMTGEELPTGKEGLQVRHDQTGDVATMIAEAERTLYEHPDIIKGFLDRPENVAEILADFLEAEAAMLEQAEYGRVIVDGHQKEATWSSAPQWFLDRNRSLRDNGGPLAKQSTTNALRKTAQGKFKSLTVGQQDMVVAALDTISRQIQGLTRPVFAGDLQVGDRFAEPDLGMRTVVGERDGRLILDNGRAVDMGAEIHVLGEVDRMGRIEGDVTPADVVLRERDDFPLSDGTNADGSERTRSAREILDEARNDVAVEKNKAHLYRHAAVCLNMG